MKKLLNWNPEDHLFWQEEGKSIAYRNLLLSSASLLLAFVVWMQWSAIIVFIEKSRPDFSTSTIYWLTALPLLIAATLRIPYSFIVPYVGGAKWNTISTAILLVPLTISFLCFEYNLPKGWYILASCLTGIAGANFSSSCSNICHFFPYRLRSIALGINSSIGNLGVGIAQWLIPLITLSYLSFNLPLNHYDIDGLKFSLSLTSLILAIPCVVFSFLSYYFMDNIQLEKSSLSSKLEVINDSQCWNMCLLYTFTFGAYIGFASVLPYIVSKYYSLDETMNLMFWGAVLSALMRPLGHVLAKFIGAVKGTLLSYFLLIAGSVGVFYSLKFNSEPWSFNYFICFYMILFLGTGLGKGTSTAMIPEIYFLRNLTKNIKDYREVAAQETASVVGFSAAIATFGAFLLPLIFSLAQLMEIATHSVFALFIICFILCFLFTYLVYGLKRKSNPLAWKSQDGKFHIMDCPKRMDLLTKENNV